MPSGGQGTRKKIGNIREFKMSVEESHTRQMVLSNMKFDLVKKFINLYIFEI